MAEKLPVAFLEFRVISHATEDTKKVYTALKNLIGSETLEEVEASREKLEGHYGNPMIFMKGKVYRKHLIRKILKTILEGLNRRDKQKIFYYLEKYIDSEGSFYLRLSKQEAYLGKIKLSEADPIRIRVKLAIPAKQKDKILEAYRSLIEGKL
jgi:hypothetical protein